MTYKTLMAIHLTDDPVSNLVPIASLARHFNAHLEVVILSALYPLPTMIMAQQHSLVWSESLPELLSKSEMRARQVHQFLETENIEFSTDIEAQQIGLMGKAVAGPALTSDLVILNRDASLISGIMAQSLEGVLFDAGKPVLVLGETVSNMPNVPEKVMIAWDGSREAARAVHHALGFLKEADTVKVFAIEESGKDQIKQSLKRLTRQLSHHGIEIESRILQSSGHDISRTLIEHVSESDSDLLVMGAYGRRRLREIVFSSATRAALNKLKGTVLLAH